MNDTVMKEAFGKLSNEQVDFLCDEFGFTKTELKEKTEGEYDELYDKLCDIEVEETPLDDTSVSERGEMASSIVTIVGNYFAEKLGYDDADEFSKFLEED